MPKQQAKSKPNNSFAWLLKFIGSLAYVYVAWQILASPPAWFSLGPSLSIQLLGLYIIAAVGIMSAIGLLLATLFSFKMDDSGITSMLTWKMAMWSTFTLLVLTLPGPSLWIVLIGFVLYSVGSAAARM